MKRHAFDPFSFIFGLAFVVVGVIFLVEDVDAADLDPAVAGFGVLIFIGSLVGAIALRLGRARSGTSEVERGAEGGLPPPSVTPSRESASGPS